MNRIIITIFLLVPTISKAEGQDLLSLVSDLLSFIFVFTLWTLGILFLFMTLKAFGKGVTNRKTRVTIWTVGLLLAAFNWTMVKHDSNPYSGPIDSLIYSSKLQKSSKIDSLEFATVKSDSTIETIIASADSNQVGIYIWLNNKKHFVRKATKGLNQTQQDSLTMTVVRSWVKE